MASELKLPTSPATREATMKVGLALAVLTLLAIAALPVVVFTAITGGGSAVTAGVTGVAGIPATALVDYELAAASCPGLSWSVLAGIGEVESDHGRSTLPGVAAGANPAGAEGPMQFLPATFAAYAVSLAGEVPSPYDLADAAVAAARMLCADGGGVPDGLAAALYAYNHDRRYVEEVLGWAASYQASASGPGQAAAAWALTQVGKPYRWGAAGPDAYDCSGLVLRAWEAAGVALPRVAAEQYGAGARLPLVEAEVGDLVFFATDPADPATIAHVGIYLGDGMMVDAPHTGADVRVEAVYPDGLVPEVTRPGG